MARDLSMGNEPQNEKTSRSRPADSKNERIGFGLLHFIPDSTQLGDSNRGGQDSLVYHVRYSQIANFNLSCPSGRHIFAIRE